MEGREAALRVGPRADELLALMPGPAHYKKHYINQTKRHVWLYIMVFIERRFVDSLGIIWPG
jgi:hypothetical protein